MKSNDNEASLRHVDVVNLRARQSYIGFVAARLAARRFLLPAVLAALTLLSPCALADSLPAVDATADSQVDRANWRPGVASSGFGGDGVDLFNGNLLVVAGNSTVLPLDGGMTLAFGRAYNSKSAHFDQFPSPTGAVYELSGQTWMGLGWTSHLGRIVVKSHYRSLGDLFDYWGRRRFFEMPNGALQQFAPYVSDAQPLLRIVHVNRDGCEPEPHCPVGSPTCEAVSYCDPLETAGDRYEVTFPDGTMYRLEPLVSAARSESSSNPGWITNDDRAGYYTTQITDVHGNTIHIEYWGSENPNYPEAIKKIYFGNDPGTVRKITTEVWTQDDADGGLCPPGAVGMLKAVHSVGFQGDRAEPQDVVMTLHYETVSLVPEFDRVCTRYNDSDPVTICESSDDCPDGACATPTECWGDSECPSGVCVREPSCIRKCIDQGWCEQYPLVSCRSSLSCEPGAECLCNIDGWYMGCSNSYELCETALDCPGGYCLALSCDADADCNGFPCYEPPLCPGLPAAVTAMVLTRVELPTPSGDPVREVFYSYGDSGGISLLAGITNPLGSKVTYEYGGWQSGGVLLSPELSNTYGVVQRDVYPTGSGTHHSWAWTREFGVVSPGTCDSSSPEMLNEFTVRGPDGRVVTAEYYGHPCGSTTYDMGPVGYPKSTRVTNAGEPFRSIDYAWDSKLDPVTGEHAETMLKSSTVTYHDDDGCFSGETGTKTMSVEYRHRTAWNQWRMEVVDGYYLPLGEGSSSGRRITYTGFYDPETAPQCLIDKHILGAYGEQFVEERGQRQEAAAEFDCFGQLVQARVRNEWVAPTTVLGVSDDQDVIFENQPADADDLLRSFTYTPAGQLASTTAAGGDTYPGGLPALPSYTTTYGWSNGALAWVQPAGLGYRTSDSTIDVSGVASRSRDPNGLEWKYDFDVLGRPVEARPPGTLEYPSRRVYPSLHATRAIVSPDASTDVTPGDTEQIFSSSETDALGRTVTARRAMADDSIAVQITRYDQLDRVIFVSIWMLESEYAQAGKTTWSSPDIDGDGLADYTVEGIPVAGEQQLGTTYFYGTSDSSDFGNPFDVAPDPLGRLRATRSPDGSTQTIDYCGPHVELQTSYRGSLVFPESRSAKTRRFYDGLGRLALVDAPPVEADAVHRYDAGGNLVEVNLVEQLPLNAFVAWKTDAIEQCQVRTFTYDAAGRQVKSHHPESGDEVIGVHDPATGEVAHAFDAAGNVLVWQDQIGLDRGYFFRNGYDSVGRLIRKERITGTPLSPLANDVDRLEGQGDFEDAGDVGAEGWEEGTIDIASGQFTAGGSGWQRIEYGGCNPAPPGNVTNLAGLYLGDHCSYNSVGAGPQAVRRPLTGVSHDDVVTFDFWRQVRSVPPGTAVAKDTLEVFVVLQSAADDISDRRYILRMDDSHASYATWRRTHDLRIGDLFRAGQWPEAETRDLYVYVVFTKGDTTSTGLGVGIMIDDVFVGRRAIETLAEYSYDEDVCASDPSGHTCLGGDETANRYLGKLSRVVSYQSDRVVNERAFAYLGLNGRLSGIRERVDWAGLGSFTDFFSRYHYDGKGLLNLLTSPYFLDDDCPRFYYYLYDREYPDGLTSGDGQVYLTPRSDPPSHEWHPDGRLKRRSLANQTREDLARDAAGRLGSIQLSGFDDNGSSAVFWDSGAYSYDGRGSIESMGLEQFAYDGAERLIHAQLIRSPVFWFDDEKNYDITYGYDKAGNMTSRLWVSTPVTPIPPANFEFTRSFGDSLCDSKNQVVGNWKFVYDRSGQVLRMPGDESQPPSAASWDDRGRLLTWYAGSPEAQAGVGETYVYDAGGNRIVTYRFADSWLGTGEPRLYLRDSAGKLLSEYTIHPTNGPRMARDHVREGSGNLVSRTRDYNAVTTYADLASSANGEYVFVIQADVPYDSYLADIRTASGDPVRRIQGIVLDEGGTYTIPESVFAAGESNHIRFRGEGANPGAYTIPVTILFDPEVTPDSPNQVRSMAVVRRGGELRVSWRLLVENDKSTRLYCQTADGGDAVELTEEALPAGVTSYTIPASSLPASCESIFAVQESDGVTTDASISGDVPDPQSRTTTTSKPIIFGPPGGGDPGPIVPPDPDPVCVYVDLFEHRDHLGSLRVVTDSWGAIVSAHDYYPFGWEMHEETEPTAGGVRRRFTGHERDDATMADYMRARYKQSEDVFFLSPDSVNDVSYSSPSSWNKYPYVRGNPINAADPSGHSMTLLPDGCYVDGEGNKYCPEGGGGYILQQRETVGVTAPDPYDEASAIANFEGLINDSTEYYSRDEGGDDDDESSSGGSARSGGASGGVAKPATQNDCQDQFKRCVGQARVLKGNPGLIGKVGAFPRVKVTQQSAAIIPGQWGGKKQLYPHLGSIEGTLADGTMFCGITDVIGSLTPVSVGEGIYMPVREALQFLNPGVLIVEIVGIPVDLGTQEITLQVPHEIPCPTGTTEAQ